MPAMPVLIAMLLEGLGALLVSATAKILVSLGVGFVTYEGLDTIMTQLTGYITASYTGMPTMVAQFAGLMQVDRGIAIILGCTSARFVLAGVSGGMSLKKMVWK